MKTEGEAVESLIQGKPKSPREANDNTWNFLSVLPVQRRSIKPFISVSSVLQGSLREGQC